MYQWLNDSNLLDGEDEDVTTNYTENYQGITEAVRIGDITIFEFKEPKYTEQFEEIPFAVTKENIGVFVSGFSSEIDGVQRFWRPGRLLRVYIKVITCLQSNKFLLNHSEIKS